MNERKDNRINVRIGNDSYSFLETECRERGTTVSMEIRRLLSEWIEQKRNEKGNG